MQKIVISIFLILVVVLIIYINKNNVIVLSDKCKENYQYGIIDNSLTNNHENIISSNAVIKKSTDSKLSHGDEMVMFSQKLCKDIKIYYYDATDENGIISTDGIIKGLKWMKEKKVDKVNLSLSTKVYSSKLEDWIKENNEISIYASYNNLMNSRDYPAMYKNVTGSGSNKKIKYKLEDYHYSSSNIVILEDLNNSYNGNSFLSLYTMYRK